MLFVLLSTVHCSELFAAKLQLVLFVFLGACSPQLTTSSTHTTNILRHPDTSPNHQTIVQAMVPKPAPRIGFLVTDTMRLKAIAWLGNSRRCKALYRAQNRLLLTFVRRSYCDKTIAFNRHTNPLFYPWQSKLSTGWAKFVCFARRTRLPQRFFLTSKKLDKSGVNRV